MLCEQVQATHGVYHTITAVVDVRMFRDILRLDKFCEPFCQNREIELTRVRITASIAEKEMCTGITFMSYTHVDATVARNCSPEK